MLRVHTFEVRLYSDAADAADAEFVAMWKLRVALTEALMIRSAIVSVETDALEPDDVPAEERGLVPIGAEKTIGEMLESFEARRAELRQGRENDG